MVYMVIPAQVLQQGKKENIYPKNKKTTDLLEHIAKLDNHVRRLMDLGIYGRDATNAFPGDTARSYGRSTNTSGCKHGHKEC